MVCEDFLRAVADLKSIGTGRRDLLPDSSHATGVDSLLRRAHRMDPRESRSRSLDGRPRDVIQSDPSLDRESSPGRPSFIDFIES